jgi:hypothetical protein
MLFWRGADLSLDEVFDWTVDDALSGLAGRSTGRRREREIARDSSTGSNYDTHTHRPMLTCSGRS